MQANRAGILILQGCPPRPFSTARTEPRGSESRTRKQLRLSSVPWARTGAAARTRTAPTHAAWNSDMTLSRSKGRSHARDEANLAFHGHSQEQLGHSGVVLSTTIADSADGSSFG